MGTYSKAEAELVPNQWWDVWDFFPNVSEREIENPYDHNWARRPEVVEQNYDKEGNLKESLQLNLSGYPVPKYTREGELYYTTVKNDSGQIVPAHLSGETWSESLPYPFGKKRNNLSDFAFASWLVNQAPSQLAPVGALAKGIPQIRNQRTLNKFKTQYAKVDENLNIADSFNVTPQATNQKNVERIFSLSRFKRIHSYENRPVHIPRSELTDFQKGAPLMTTTGGSDDGLVPKWDFDFEGSQFSNTSDVKGLNKPGEIKTPQQERNWYSKLTYQRVKEEVLAQGGTKFDADKIFAKHRANFKTYKDGGRGLVSTITELNNMFQKWSPGIQVRTEKYTRNGQDMYRWTFKDVDGKRTRWDFEREDIDGIVKAYSTTTFAKDHLIPVKDKDRTGGGYYGADNPGNFEILYQFVNIQKSNTTQLHPAILKEMGVPNSLSEYINMELYPQNYEGASVPQRWKENFQKIVLADYYEKVRGLKSINKRNAVMQKLISKHSTFFKDPLNIKGLEMLEEALGQQVAKNMEEGVAAGNEVPSWLGLLQRPPGGWNSKDPWWNSLPDDAKQRYKWMYEYRDRTITQPYKRPPQGNKMYD